MTYFDAASGEPLEAAGRTAMVAALDDGWADPARLYRDGRRARLLLDAARESIASVIGARPDETHFTASGTQAVHMGVAAVLRGRRRAGSTLVVNAVEHSSVLHAGEVHAASGGRVTTVGVSREGRVSVSEFADACDDDVALACLQAANHEVGTVQPVAEVAEALGSVPLLVDAAQVVGRMAVPAGWSVLTASAHKWGGPLGVGVLAVRKGTRFAPTWPVDERESGRVPGAVNLPAVIGAAAALAARESRREAEAARLSAAVDRLRARIPELVPDVEVVGDPVNRLPNLVTFSCLYVDGEALLLDLDKAGFAVSSGSSCTSSTLTPSHVLEAMGVLSHGNVRVSLPFGASAEDVDRFLTVLPEVVGRIRGSAPVLSAAAPTADAGRLVIDTLGKKCPIPVIELAKHIGDVPVGGEIDVLSDDVAARLDIPAWCEMREQEYVGEQDVEGGVAYRVRRVS